MTSYSPGSVKLFGEHAVVYDRVGVSAAFDRHARVSIKKSKSQSLELNLHDFGLVGKVGEEELEDWHQQLDYLFSKKDFKGVARLRESNIALPFYYLIGWVFSRKGFRPLSIEVSSTIPRSSGLGSSAAVFSALANELNTYFLLGMDRNEVADLANKGDAVVHGNPSGIDVSTCSYGGFLKFRKSEGISPLSLENQCSALIVNTGVAKDTGKMISKVSKQISDDKMRVNEIFDNMQTAAFAGIDALEEGDLQKLGAEFNRAQKMFEDLGLTTRETDDVISIARKHKAYGAKITGAGGGGCVIVLAEKPSKFLPVFEQAGYSAFETRLGAEGVRHSQTIL